MVAQFHDVDSREHFDVLHFHDWHPSALHQLKDRATILTFHSTEWGRSGNHVVDSWIYREISGKERDGALIAKKVTAVSATMRKEVVQLLQYSRREMRRRPERGCPREFQAKAGPGDIRRDTALLLLPRSSFLSGGSTQKGPDLLINAIRQVARTGRMHG